MTIETVTTKPAAKSKVLWFNVLAVVAAVAGAIPVVMEKLPFVSPDKAASIAAAGVVVVATINGVLRFFTERPVSLRGATVKQIRRPD